jgi:cytochrome c peroxidase
MSLPALHHSKQACPSRIGLWPVLNFLFILLATPCFSAEPPLKDHPHLRRPIAAAWIEPNKLLAVANQKSGSISIVDFPNRQVLDEIAIGQRLTDLVAHPKSGLLLATDDKQHELIVLRRDGNTLSVAQRLAVSPHPVTIAISPNGNRLSIASLWSRKLTIFKFSADDNSINRFAEIPLAFNPREHGFLASEDYLTVKDAFSSRFDAISIRERQNASSHDVPPAPPLTETPHSYSRTPRGQSAQVRNGQEVYFHDGVPLALGPVPEPTPADRGEALFFDRSLSGDRQLSCHSCHALGHTTYQLADTLGDETTGTPKRIPTLLGTRLTDPWAWNGKIRDLNEQVRKSLETTMHAASFTQQQVGDIAAFLHTLEPPPPLEPANDDPFDKAQLARGLALFQNLNCGKCHVAPLTYTSSDAFDVGLSDEQGLTKFNPPSLRGVSQGYTFFHDGRAKSLADVFTTHGHMLDRALTDNELADLLRFLRSL